VDRIDLKVGFQCNNSCRFCVQAHKKDLCAGRPLSELVEILRQSADRYEAVVFTGGEVTIRSDVLRLVEAARDAGYKRIHIQSNGRMFAYKNFCKDMITAGANEFGLALHGHTPELHDYLTASHGSFANTVRGIKNIRNLDHRVITNTVITKSNYRHLPEIARLLTGLGVAQYQFAFVHIVGNAMKNALSVVPRKTLVKPFVLRGLDVGISMGVNVMTEAIPLCFLGGYEKYAAENVIPEPKIFASDCVIESFTESRIQHGKAKGPPCHECPACSLCEGPWKEYTEMFGWSEFTPLTTERVAVINNMRQPILIR
jgi:MoaA/NifB/PqqE/SkfB family radical SAM enzyme